MPSKPRRCLVFSPGLAGHREIYVRVLAGWLAARGISMALAADLSEADRPATPLLDDLADVLDGRVIDLRDQPDGGAAMTLAQLRRVVERAEADVTVFAEADDHLGALAAMAAPGARPLPGRLAGVFLRSTNYIYEEDGTGGHRERGKLGRLLWRAGRRADPRTFHEVLQPGGRLLAAALCLDEHFVAGHAAGHAWLPDISAAFDDVSEARWATHAETIEWGRRLDELRGRLGGRPLLAYLGAAQRRRGYDTILRLALRTGAAVAHCGRPPSSDDGGLAADRDELLAAGRLLETGGPYQNAATATAFVKAARCVVLPYRAHLGSSGVMLQAVAAGRPVLVTDEGLMAWRTRTFGLGETVAAGDEAALADTFLRLDRVGPEPYAASLAGYITAFTRGQVEAALDAAVGLGGAGARLPMHRTAAGGVS